MFSSVLAAGPFDSLNPIKCWSLNSDGVSEGEKGMVLYLDRLLVKLDGGAYTRVITEV